MKKFSENQMVANHVNKNRTHSHVKCYILKCCMFNTYYRLICIRYLLKNDGLFVGSSSAMNCVGAVKVAQKIGPGHTIITILCDSGMRHLSKFYDAEYLFQYHLVPSATGLEFLGLS